MITARLFLALCLPSVLLGGPALADHGGPLASAPMSPLVTALLAGGLAFVTVVLLAVIWRLMAGSRRDTK